MRRDEFHRYFDRLGRAERRLFDPHNPLEFLTAEEVFVRFRFRPRSITIFYIVDLMEDSLRHPAGNGSPLPLLLEVLVALRYVASKSNSFYSVVGDCFPHLPKSTCFNCTRRVTTAIKGKAQTLMIVIGYHLADGGAIVDGFYAVAGEL